jgi:hypothetical protein
MRPSGLMSGDESEAGCVVSARCMVPSADHSHRSVRPLFSFMSKLVTGATMVLPSGVMVGGPMRWICHERSALMGTPSAAIAGRVAPKASTAARTRRCIIVDSWEAGGTGTIPQRVNFFQIKGLHYRDPRGDGGRRAAQCGRLRL